MSSPAVSVSDLLVRFGDHRVLDGITFEAQGGDFVAIVGPNGAGKTTLMKVLLGLDVPENGIARIFGQHPQQVDPGIVGYVPQIKTLDRSFPALAIELVVSGLYEHWPFRISQEERELAIDALEHVHAEKLADRSLSALSGGELQRVYLARSLIRTPRVIILDEPATGVDVVGATDLYELLDNYQEEHQATVLMVTHDWNAAFHHATHVLLLDGRQVAYGPPEAALKEECLREAFGHIGHAHAMMIGDRHE
ncbi:ABC transporter ATP-binding protein [Longibacter salinarum]|uniref:ABC transporter ATP-binding protein n=1 Tax=Longibacter salinarum TaxID=1850348 RepID=A0A2A8D0G8_9BACT|nr:ABC transporter ATP-binding protein [Longibacter salinarum]PEN14435.1 ABC transporter ATP-binding protein [Longibacter salinarum]